MPSEKIRYILKKSHCTPPSDSSSKEKKLIFNVLKQLNNSELIDILESAYEEMNSNQKRNIFEKMLRNTVIETLNGEDLIADINSFIFDSKNGVYYAPFKKNYKNYTHVPEKTEEWFSRVADFLIYASQLAKNGDYQNTVLAFKLIYQLIGAMNDFVFADELGAWMLPVNEAECLYFNVFAISKIYDGVEYANEIISLLKIDSTRSFLLKIYESALKSANKEQIDYLNEEILRKKIKIK